jgi:DNA polymerase-3 subunit delta
LKSALLARDVLKANRIVQYFAENPKANPIQVTLAMLFNFYSNLMLAYYAPEKSEQGVAAQLGLRSSWQAREYLQAMHLYSGVKVMQIIGEIRYCDAKSKGVGNSSLSDGELLKELVYKILH